MIEQNSTIDGEKSDNDPQHDHLADEEINPVPNTIELHPREQKHIEKLRKKIRIIDPASVYKYRHIKLSAWNSFFHLITLFASTALFLLINYYGLSELASITLEGVGEVSELTIIDKLSIYLPLFIVFISFISLRKNSKKTPIPRYRLAMFSNSLNRALLNNIKLFSYPFILGIGILITLEHYNLDIDSSMALIFNGVVYDIILAILSVISVLIYYRAFRFCFKRQ